MNSKKQIRTIFSGFAAVAIPVVIVSAVLIYMFIFGNPGNFQGGDVNNHPLPGNYLGIIYKGGVVVPVLLALFMIVIVFAIERFITISRSRGKGSVNAFIANVHAKLSNKQLDEAIAACDNQRGSVANVVRSGLIKFKEMIPEKGLNRDQKTIAIKQDIEEATSLELPMLEQNLVILATLASVSTLVGLFGTVLGMIKAFSALATAGAPDAIALANGISEALINTALGILTSTLAIIFYNYFTTKIDKITYAIDEAGVAIVQNYAANYN